MSKPILKLDEFKRSLPALAAKIADRATQRQPLPWPREVGQALRRDVAEQVDKILTDDYGLEPIQEFRDIADDALLARCDQIFHAFQMSHDVVQ